MSGKCEAILQCSDTQQWQPIEEVRKPLPHHMNQETPLSMHVTGYSQSAMPAMQKTPTQASVLAPAQMSELYAGSVV